MSEMTQDEIKYINMDSNHLSGWLWNAPFKSLGNVIHWIYTYSNLHIAEPIQVGNNVVELYGKKIADIEWNAKMKIPTFIWTLDFIDEHEWIVDNQEFYLRMSKVDHSKLSPEFRERWAMYDVLREQHEEARNAKC